MITIDESLFQEDNWASVLTEEQRNKIAAELIRDIGIDEQSRSEWVKETEQWTDLAMQVRQAKSFPWNGASNVQYPLLTTASMQFHSRAQGALLKGNKPIKAKSLGPDPKGEKAARGKRVEDFMGYLLLHGMQDWEEDVDRMLMVLPVVGTAYKKIYFSASREMPHTELVLPNELILNYNATDFNRARRTHIMTKFHNELVELQRAGFFLDEELSPTNELGTDDQAPQERTLYESHCWFDLDDDGYEEPYIITIDKESSKVLRVAPRFTEELITRDGKSIVKIRPIEFFVRYIFLPRVDSKLYGAGLGTLLGPTNMAVNTLINQLVDAGTLSVLPSGFLGRGARISRSGPVRFGPGEWKTLQSTGDDLRKGVFPLPVKEPSNVLFQLLGTLIDSGKQIGSVADIMLGESPGQNQPFSTTSAVLEQGLKVFVSIYKRVYRSMTDEYKMIMSIVAGELQEVYQEYNDQSFSLIEDFSARDLSFVPVSDPDMVSEAQRVLRGESLLQKLAMGLPLNVQEVTKRVLEAEDHENIQALMQVPPPKPDPELQFKHMELEVNTALAYAQMEKEMPIDQMEMFKDHAQAMLNLTKAKKIEEETVQQGERDFAEAYVNRKRVEVEKEKVKQSGNKSTNSK